MKEETPEKPKGTPTADKAGWIKKSSGGFLGLWKERYILLCKTQLLVYEDEVRAFEKGSVGIRGSPWAMLAAVGPKGVAHCPGAQVIDVMRTCDIMTRDIASRFSLQ